MTRTAISLGLLGAVTVAASVTAISAFSACNANANTSNRPQIIQVEAPGAAAPSSPNAPAPGAMAITGSAVLEVAPDTADLTMTLTSEAPKPALAAQSVDTKEQALVDRLAKVGVDTSDIKLSYVTLEPVYEYPAPYESWSPRVRTYRAAVTVTATTKKFVDIGAMMEASADAGATSLSTQFRRSDLPALKKQVRDMAIAAARAKAKQTADGLGITLGRIVSVSEGPNNGGNFYYPQTMVANNVRSEAPAANAIALGATLQPLQLDITISYELPKS